jgi:Major tropism determinant N-terminal domain
MEEHPNMPAITKLQIRRGTAAEWSATNPVLADGELGWDTTNLEFKMGDGVTNWTALPYLLADDLAAKAPLSNPAFTGTVSGITKSMVGLGNVDNTADTAKPVSTAQQTALNLKANLASPAFTGTPTGITKSHVGLGNVDNTSDANKPLSTIQGTAVDLKVAQALIDNGQPSNALGNKLWKVGVVADVTTGTTYDNVLTESMTVIVDPESGRLAGTYTAYGTASGAQKASIVLSYSDDGITWNKKGVLIAGSGVVGSPDEMGTTGPVLVLDNDLYHLFYIGLTATGYEGGNRTLCLATSPSLKNPVWTRKGEILSPGGTGWRAQDIWHPSIVRKAGKWYCFVNATGADGNESIGFATATSLTGPWTFDDVKSPVISKGSSTDNVIGDPCVTKIADGWRMDYFASGPNGAEDWYTSTQDADFPTGWQPHDRTSGRKTVTVGPAGTFDELWAHKPFILHYGGRTLHYYTAVMANNTNRRVALAIDGPIGTSGIINSKVTPVRYGNISQVRNNAEGSVVFPSAGPYSTPIGAMAVVQANVNDTLQLTLGYVANADVGDLRVDAVTMNASGVIVNYASGLGNTGHGISGWGAIGGRYTHAGGTFYYQVQAADLVNGCVKMYPVMRAEGGIRGVQNSTADPTWFAVRNLDS